MPAPLLAALATSVVPALARQGLDLLSGVIRGAGEAGVARVAGMIEEKTGIKVDEIAEETLTEKQWVALRNFELQNQELLLRELEATQAHEIAKLRVAAGDRENARALQTAALASEDWLTRNFLHLYAAALTALTFGFIFFVASADLYELAPDPLREGRFLNQLSAASQARARVVDTVLGFLLGVTLSAVIQFFFGSSAGSASKGRTIDRLLDDKGGEGV